MGDLESSDLFLPLLYGFKCRIVYIRKLCDSTYKSVSFKLERKSNTYSQRSLFDVHYVQELTKIPFVTHIKPIMIILDLKYRLQRSLNDCTINTYLSMSNTH